MPSLVDQSRGSGVAYPNSTLVASNGVCKAHIHDSSEYQNQELPYSSTLVIKF